MLLGAMSLVTLIMFNISVVFNNPNDSKLTLLSLIAQAEDTPEIEWGCAGNSTFVKNNTLKHRACVPLVWNSYLKCVDEVNVCCDPSKQTTCDGSLPL